jgi:hypothetical protein
MVYKTFGPINRQKTKAFFHTHSYMSPKEAWISYHTSHIDASAVIKKKSTGDLFTISTTYIGYVLGARVGGTYPGTPHSSSTHPLPPRKKAWPTTDPNLIGYVISWQSKEKQFNHFEDEWSLIPLKDIVILDAQQLYEELRDDSREKQKDK